MKKLTDKNNCLGIEKTCIKCKKTFLQERNLLSKNFRIKTICNYCYNCELLNHTLNKLYPDTKIKELDNIHFLKLYYKKNINTPVLLYGLGKVVKTPIGREIGIDSKGFTDLQTASQIKEDFLEKYFKVNKTFFESKDKNFRKDISKILSNKNFITHIRNEEY